MMPLRDDERERKSQDRRRAEEEHIAMMQPIIIATIMSPLMSSLSDDGCRRHNTCQEPRHSAMPCWLRAASYWSQADAAALFFKRRDADPYDELLLMRAIEPAGASERRFCCAMSACYVIDKEERAMLHTLMSLFVCYKIQHVGVAHKMLMMNGARR